MDLYKVNIYVIYVHILIYVLGHTITMVMLPDYGRWRSFSVFYLGRKYFTQS